MTALEHGTLVKLTGAGWKAFGVVGLEIGSRHEITGFWYDGTPVIQDTTGEEWALQLHSPEDDAPFWGATTVPAPTTD
ncbi:hypothetical protein [Microbacterium sp. T32]|uniref:hypothetical protein n=1 Tax=Microbacterium sp. T32 TaxID=1776083 RepID=UPI0007AC1D8D|nr:hypothetical protein [Microbacterium sp. T32]KZE41372.1 hypothetical protein AVW09_01950 [Microbacterium sp. T32]